MRAAMYYKNDDVRGIRDHRRHSSEASAAVPGSRFGDHRSAPGTGDFRGSIRDGFFTGEAQTFRNRLEDVTFRLTKVHRSSPTLGKRPPKGSNIVRT